MNIALLKLATEAVRICLPKTFAVFKENVILGK